MAYVACSEGLDIQIVFVNDDVAFIPRSQPCGTPGIVFVIKVDKQDVKEAFMLLDVAIMLLDVAMQQFVMDHLTGTVDMEFTTTRVSPSERTRRENLLSTAHKMIMEKMQLGGPSTRIIEEEYQNQDDGVWNLSMEGGTCLGFVAKVVGDVVLPLVMPFVESNIMKPKWHL